MRTTPLCASVHRKQSNLAGGKSSFHKNLIVLHSVYKEFYCLFLRFHQKNFGTYHGHLTTLDIIQSIIPYINTKHVECVTDADQCGTIRKLSKSQQEIVNLIFKMAGKPW